MTAIEYYALCHERTIDPSLALENDLIIAAIHQNDKEALIEVLETEF
jgi:hypothetical protein